MHYYLLLKITYVKILLIFRLNLQFKSYSKKRKDIKTSVQIIKFHYD